MKHNVEQNWQCFEETYGLRETPLFAVKSMTVKIRVFWNSKTGEIKLIDAISVDKNGTDYYIKQFNEK